MDENNGQESRPPTAKEWRYASEEYPNTDSDFVHKILREYISDEYELQEAVTRIHDELDSQEDSITKQELLERLRFFMSELKGDPAAQALLRALDATVNTYRDLGEQTHVHHQTICNKEDTIRMKLDRKFSTRDEQAEALDISRPTLFRYLKDPKFPTTYWEQLLYVDRQRQHMYGKRTN